MEEAHPASTRGYNPIGKSFLPEKLQNLQANKIQVLILSLQSLIPTGTALNNPAPHREQETITQDEEDLTIPPTPTDATVDEWRQLAEGGELVPPPPLLQTPTAPPQGPSAATPQARWRAPSTLEELGLVQDW